MGVSVIIAPGVASADPPGRPVIDPGWIKEGAVPPVRDVPPLHQHSNNQVVDGRVNVIPEYVYSGIEVLDDWVGLSDMGEMRFHLAGPDVSFGFRLPKLYCTPEHPCSLLIVIDENRDITLKTGMAEELSGADRGFILTWPPPVRISDVAGDISAIPIADDIRLNPGFRDQGSRAIWEFDVVAISPADDIRLNPIFGNNRPRLIDQEIVQLPLPYPNLNIPKPDFSLVQYSGVYKPGTLPKESHWPVKAAMSSAMANGSMGTHIELMITRPQKLSTPGNNQKPDPPTPFGLVVAIESAKGKQITDFISAGSYYIWPNEIIMKGAGGHWVGLPSHPWTYAAINPAYFTDPQTGFLTMNLALVPMVADGGDGSPHDFAAYASRNSVDVACMQEAWEFGQRREIITLAWEMNKRHAVGYPDPCEGMSEAACAAYDALFAISDGIKDKALHVKNDPGLLILSRSTVSKSAKLEFDNSKSGCKGADCMKEKGVLWARVGTRQSEQKPPCNPTRPGQEKTCTPTFDDPDQYIDVFCTHLQASCDGLASAADYLRFLAALYTIGYSELLQLLGYDLFSLSAMDCNDEDDHKGVQEKQIARLGEWIDEYRMPDRPAIVMGDFNVNGRSYGDIVQGRRMYQKLAESLGATKITKYEESTKELFSRRHDTGLGFTDGVASMETGPIDTWVQVTGTDPVYPHQVYDLAHDNPSMPIEKFGYGTKAIQEHCAIPGDARYDYIWIIPPKESLDVPFFVVGNQPEPYAEVHGDIPVKTHYHGRCPSDHAFVHANIQFINRKHTPAFNPLRPHMVRQSVSQVKTKNSDCWGSEDFYGVFRRRVNGGPEQKWTSDVISNKNAPSCDWGFDPLKLAGEDVVDGDFRLWEADSGPVCGDDDWYDTTPWAGWETFTQFHHGKTWWMFTDLYDEPVRYFCFLPIPSVSCPGSDTEAFITWTEGTSKKQSAVVTHEFKTEVVYP
ncbi:MAG: hypothetical protein FWD57_05180 [Polyangiaceae bacterium]|nr:hypothetical protein [Polyangiaceae bacterium]